MTDKEPNTVQMMVEGRDFTISKPWVGLTEEERDHLEGLHLYAVRGQVEAWIEGVPAFIDAIEAKLREKNV